MPVGSSSTVSLELELPEPAIRRQPVRHCRPIGLHSLRGLFSNEPYEPLDVDVRDVHASQVVSTERVRRSPFSFLLATPERASSRCRPATSSATPRS